jgi:hypothetical protein
MRWEQKISNNISTISSSVKLYTSEVETYETVHPFRKFKQTYKEGYWQLPKGIDNLVNTMEKARLEKNWEVADTIRKKLIEIGIVVRNGKDWYPKLLELEVRAEKDFSSWLYSASKSGGKSEKKSQAIKDFFDDKTKKLYDL